eukprot:8149600-Pyramimonas_sp.AAC.1
MDEQSYVYHSSACSDLASLSRSLQGLAGLTRTYKTEQDSAGLSKTSLGTAGLNRTGQSLALLS